MLRTSWLGLLAGLLARPAAAAPTPADSLAAPLPRLTLALTTATRTTYLERAPTSADDYGLLGTTLTYQAPSGFMGSAYLNHSYAASDLHEPFINFGEATVGWQSTGDGDTYWTAQYAHLFSYGESTLVQAGLSNDLSASLTHYFDWLTASASLDLFVGRVHDVVLTFDVSHEFAWPVQAHSSLTLEPTVELGVGSQHYYAASLGKTSKVKESKRHGTITVFREPATPAFAPLGFTFSAPLTLHAGRYELSATPAYLVPLNVPTGGNDKSIFYFTAGVSRTFW